MNKFVENEIANKLKILTKTIKESDLKEQELSFSIFPSPVTVMSQLRDTMKAREKLEMEEKKEKDLLKKKSKKLKKKTERN